jgi:hypothetical protein
MIEVIYTSIEKNPNITSRQDRLFVGLDSKCYPYRCYDLVTYRALKQVVEVYYNNISNLVDMRTYQQCS